MRDLLGDPGFGTADDLYHQAPCGYLSVRPDGTVVRVNQTFLDWTGLDGDDVVGERRFSELLTAGGRIYHETHFRPLLLLQDEVRDVALEIQRADGSLLPVLVNGTLLRAGDGEPEMIRLTVFDATARHDYERELLRARRAAEASEQEVRGIAETLQRSMLQGSVEHGDGFAVETRYEPAVDSLQVGGDWHDAFVLDDGRTLGVSVGDVVGKGLAAACAMGQLRSALRALAATGAGPGGVLDQLDRFVPTVPDAAFSTVAYAEVDLTDPVVRFACAGHPPPVVVRGGGGGELLWGGRSVPLGAWVGKGPRRVGEAPFDVGDRLLLYSDGLVERRDRPIDDGLGELVQAAATAGAHPLDVMLDELTAALIPDGSATDDVCLLLVERRSA